MPTVAPSKKLTPWIQRADYATKNERDVEFEKEVAKQKLEYDPEHVTHESSVRQFEPPTRPASGTDSAGLKGDLHRVQEALALGSVPPLSYQLGLAGTIPYLATSLATCYCSWNMNTEWPSQSQFLNHIMVSNEQAAHYLHLLEPIQVGYGAVIISFLGAIHWGLEYAEKHPDAARTRFRYGLGVLAPVLAWPTMVMPVQFALTAQFAAFTFMYFADTRAATRGWTPTWYSTYRFVLTFIVGSSIVVSLVAREKFGEDKPRLTGLREKFHKDGPDEAELQRLEKLEETEREKNRKKKEIEEKKKELEEKKKKIEEEEKEQEDKLKSGDKKGKKSNKGEKSEGAKSKDDAKDEGKDDSKDEGEDEAKDQSKDDAKDADGEQKDEGGDEKADGKDDKSE